MTIRVGVGLLTGYAAIWLLVFKFADWSGPEGIAWLNWGLAVGFIVLGIMSLISGLRFNHRLANKERSLVSGCS